MLLASGEHPPHLAHALMWFCKGLLATVGAVMFGYLTQLRLYNEERSRHEGKPFAVLHSRILTIGLILAAFAAIAFFMGCLHASAALAKAT
jgi:hypothetical protein